MSKHLVVNNLEKVKCLTGQPGAWSRLPKIADPAQQEKVLYVEDE